MMWAMSESAARWPRSTRAGHLHANFDMGEARILGAAAITPQTQSVHQRRSSKLTVKALQEWIRVYTRLAVSTESHLQALDAWINDCLPDEMPAAVQDLFYGRYPTVGETTKLRGELAAHVGARRETVEIYARELAARSLIDQVIPAPAVRVCAQGLPRNGPQLHLS